MKTFFSLLSAAALVSLTTSSMAQVYLAPSGGWNYTYDGNAGAAGSGGFTALDGSWSHDNGSDEWDGSTIGAGNPGGVSVISEGGGDYLRLQDTGDPRDYGFADPGSVRKIFLGHDIGANGAPGNILDLGVTLSFRARLPTDGLLDLLRPDGGGGTTPYPAGGDGYLLHDGGKDNFGIKQANGGLISFALSTASDTGGPAGLTMNNLNGSGITGDVDWGEGGSANVLALDPTQWHEFWITIGAGGAGTHTVDVYLDGSLVPFTFDVTAGSGDDFGGLSYISMGVGSTGQSGALDVDFFSFANGVYAPVPEPTTWALFGLGALGFLVARRRRA